MPITDLPADEQAFWNEVADAMADQSRDEPDVEAFLALLAD